MPRNDNGDLVDDCSFFIVHNIPDRNNNVLLGQPVPRERIALVEDYSHLSFPDACDSWNETSNDDEVYIFAMVPNSVFFKQY
jgi:hypothetical protein